MYVNVQILLPFDFKRLATITIQSCLIFFIIISCFLETSHYTPYQKVDVVTGIINISMHNTILLLIINMYCAHQVRQAFANLHK